MEAKHLHFIGICGVAMSAIALAFKRQGWHVTGSDVGFYPPISTYLKESDIEFYPGWHPKKMEKPDLVVVGNVASSTNPEWLYVHEQKLNYKSYPEVIAEYFVKKNSIVCAGTYGKTTSAGLMTWILKEAGFDPSYMFGGLMSQPTPTPPKRGIALPSAEMVNSDWSILEGDEYKTSRWDSGAKFFHYSPTHLLLTSVVWDHADVYPTEESYIEAFKKLVAVVPDNGLKVVSEKALNHLSNDGSNHHPPRGGHTGGVRQVSDSPRNGLTPPVIPLEGEDCITYGKLPTNDYVYSNITQSKNGIEFDITHNNQTYHLACPSLGEFMADNATGCFALANEIGIAPEKIIAAIATFPGMKRRLEKRYEGSITIFDDIAHSPPKAKAILESLKQIYTVKIIAIFEPNTGNRRPQAAAWYDQAFAAADEVMIPLLTKVKFDQTELEPPFEGDELTRIIATTHPDVRYMPDDEQLIEYLQQKTQPCDVVVFLGSHGFRGMIEEVIQQVSSRL